MEYGSIPKDINHFRVGEAAFFGVSPLNGKRFKELFTDTFEFNANIIELEEKRSLPEGILSDANVGHTMVHNKEADGSAMSFKAILDFGLLDVDKSDIEAVDSTISFVGVTSDMLVVDLGENKTEDGKLKYKVGDQIKFIPNYMAVARLLNSKFIEKKFI